ncbi:MAG: hypothetical protein GTN81_15370 [Proteobacteria bacterium]|nr:hypothetical protein [Pseudomonadota bacterium]
MDSSQRKGTGLNTHPSILTLVLWLIAMLVTYSIITIQIDRIKGRIRESGIQITLESSKLVSLPLLEKDVQTIQRVLFDAAKRSGVIYTSVVDHENQVVAFTGAEHLLTEMTGAARPIEKVAIWEGEFATYSKILNFASEVTYGGTKIGGILVGLSATEAFKIRKKFIIVAVSSALILLSVIIFVNFQSVRSIVGKFQDFNRASSVVASISEKSRVTCPLCGMQKALSYRVFNRRDLDRLLIIEASKYESGRGEPSGSKGIKLSELAKREDLSWIKRQVVFRCTEIIRKLAT